MVLKPSNVIDLPHKCWKRHRTDDRRVRAGGSIKGQAKGLTFYADRPRTRISLSIAQRGLTGNLLNSELLSIAQRGLTGNFIEIGIAAGMFL
jgi:hypothetical protein